MKYQVCVALLAALLPVAFEARAADEVLTPEHLVGRWVLNNGNCKDANAEHTTFRENGAAESSNGGKLQAAGFWRLTEGPLKLNVMASPAFFHEKLSAMAEEYYSFEINITPFNIKESSFEALGVLGEEVRRATFTRCTG